MSRACDTGKSIAAVSAENHATSSKTTVCNHKASVIKKIIDATRRDRGWLIFAKHDVCVISVISRLFEQTLTWR